MPSVAESRALFQPIVVGNMRLQHKLAMAPLTRFRADDLHTHTAMAIEYYTQRCQTPGTLIISEATFISPAASGYPNAPGIYSPDQIEAWKKIVDAVHAKGCFIVMQLWALGRAAVTDVLKAQGGFEVVSASDIPFEGGATPRPLSIPEIEQYVKDYATAAHNFVNIAGGDGIELHCANGYLVDSFIQTVSNKRNDIYGGSVENRTRFARDAIAAIVAVVGPKRTGLRLSPFSTFQDMKMPMKDIKETFSSFVQSIKESHPTFAYIHVVEPRIAGIHDLVPNKDESVDFLYDIWAPSAGGRVFLVAGGFTPETALKEAETRPESVIVFGRYFISNPDLPERIRKGQAFTPYDRDVFYVYGADKFEGYTTYKNFQVSA